MNDNDSGISNGLAAVLFVVGYLVLLAITSQPRPVYYYGPMSAEDAYQQRAERATALEEQSNRYGR